VYAFVDRPVTSLDRGGRFLVWSLRSWAAVAARQQCPGAALAPAFAKWRMIAGLQPFVRLMIGLQRDALKPMRFCALPCQRIAEDEALVLALFVAASEGRRGVVRDTLALLIDESAIGDALDAVLALSTALDGAAIAPGLPQGQ
jgi:hypothetical protein